MVTARARPEMIGPARSAAGIVTDGGGALSPAAILARELALPCVVWTRCATWRIESGWRIRVDGSTGAVTRLVA
jgi:pyruvate,water dikinase